MEESAGTTQDGSKILYRSLQSLVQIHLWFPSQGLFRQRYVRTPSHRVVLRKIPEDAFSIIKRSCGKQNAISVEEILGREVNFEELSDALVYGFEKSLGFKLSGVMVE